MDVSALGAFLKSRRDRLTPSDVGLPSGPRRRVPGLRRDEVARLAQASVEYYTELEQGRGPQPSEQMLASLTRALRLTADERDHVYHLAGRALPSRTSTAAHVHPGMLDLLDRLHGTPAQVITDLHAPLVQNPMAAALLGRPEHHAGPRAGFIHQWFLDPVVRRRYHPEEHDHQSRVLVADLRAVSARRAGARDVTELVRDLTRGSAEFAGLWERHEVAVRRQDRKRLVHPQVGVVEVHCLSLLSEDGTQRLLWFTPAPGTDAAEKLELLATIGEQDLAPASAAERRPQPHPAHRHR
ncbi:helix-turn-helix domain-containing protein [Cellulomonas sp. JZ18]|uniref:helix-turn-helix transcriptional regulator n=1 Tax=Cellulomonas sp. JZ18 TaxID=2654191 RepID=UPI0012D433CD|nr:helix-turn-helix transcriptional regulator [Cellulomonas sp. JZ18]QGQ20498.1 helix-turn-helix domain-containing protein [Cellulomonas sp. JZ18]